MGQRITPEEEQRISRIIRQESLGISASTSGSTFGSWGSYLEGGFAERGQTTRPQRSEGIPDQRYKEMELRIKILEEKINQIEDKVEKAEVEDILLRDINLNQAKQEIAQYFKENDGKEIGYEELIEELKIEPKMVINACNELVEEGKIG